MTPPTTIFLMLGLIACTNIFIATEAYDPLDPYGNITITWDIRAWTPDGYSASVTMTNFQQFRHIEDPGWSLGWTWAHKEIIWNMIGAQATEQGDCSSFKTSILPHTCKRSPSIVDLMPGSLPYNQQVANCCKGGVLSSTIQNGQTPAAGRFSLTVGQAGATTKTVRLPKQFTLKAPGPGYTCSPASIVKPTRFPSADKRRITQTLMTWKVTCMYSQFLARKMPTCCVSLSAFYSKDIVPCSSCSCGCRIETSTCVEPDARSQLASSSPNISNELPEVQCSQHMCPIRVHWHIVLNYKGYWRVKVTVTNFNHGMNYSDWNIVVQHPNFNNLVQSFNFNSKALDSYETIYDTAMLWGVNFYNGVLMEAGPQGHVQSDLLFRKDRDFTCATGWAFPRRIYFNGENCVMPPPDVYPQLPSTGRRYRHNLVTLLSFLLIVVLYLLSFLH